MASNRLTPLAFKKLKPREDEQTISDGGGLFIRIRSIADGGALTFRYCYRIDGKQRWKNLDAKTLTAARAERDKIKAEVKKGIDPMIERELEIERQRQAQLDEQAEIARKKALTTVSGLFERWLEIGLMDRKDSGKAEIRRMFEKDVLPIIGDLIVVDIKKGHITNVVDKLLARGVPRMAKLIFALMRQMFRFAVERDIIEHDPTAAIQKAKIGGKDIERERVLSQDEIRLLHQQLPEAHFLPTTEAAIWIMLSTCCRVGEISKARWDHIDFEKCEWTIPAEHAKNEKPHIVYLSDFALRQFRIVAQFQETEWLFPNRAKTSHVCEKSISKQVQGRQCEKVYSNRTQCNQALVLPGGRWTPHDLRRTGATLMNELGVLPDVIERCLNHTEQNRMKRVYQRHEYRNEQAEAWRLLGDRLELLTGNHSNVTPLRRAV